MKYKIKDFNYKRNAILEIVGMKDRLDFEIYDKALINEVSKIISENSEKIINYQINENYDYMAGITHKQKIYFIYDRENSFDFATADESLESKIKILLENIKH